MLSSVFGIANGAASSESSEEALLKKQAEEMEEVPSPFALLLPFLIISTISFLYLLFYSGEMVTTNHHLRDAQINRPTSEYNIFV